MGLLMEGVCGGWGMGGVEVSTVHCMNADGYASDEEFTPQLIIQMELSRVRREPGKVLSTYCSLKPNYCSTLT